MTIDAPFTAPRKKINILWWLGGLFLLLAVLFVFQLFGPNPRIIVSPQTTHITEPLGRDGLPNYEQYVLQLYRKGITPENNAAVLLWQALWPGELDPSQYAAVAAELGLSQIPSAEDALVPVYGKVNLERIAAWLSLQTAKPALSADSEALFDSDLSLENVAEEAADQLLNQVMSRPWTSEQIPPLAKWVRENKEPLDLIVEGSRRPRCYFPSPSLLDDDHESLIAMMLQGVQSVRETGRSLSGRAMWHLGEGRVDEAWQDILATHRIARLTAQGHTLVEKLVGIALDGIACDKTLTLLQHADLQAEQARTIQRELDALADLSGMADSIDLMERALYLDAVTRIGTGRSAGMLSDVGMDGGESALTIFSVDWNVVLRKGNEYYDRFAAAARLPTRTARAEAFSKITADLMQRQSELRTPATYVAAAFSQSGRGDVVAGVMANLFLPALDAATNAQDRGNTVLQLTRLAAALAVYRAEQGALPEKLDDLAPSVLKTPPVDLYNAKPFIYKRDGEGYLLYSAGENGIDDGGSNEQQSIFEGRSLDELDDDEAETLRAKVPAQADDISIRVPRPAFKMPKIEPPTDAP